MLSFNLEAVKAQIEQAVRTRPGSKNPPVDVVFAELVGAHTFTVVPFQL